MIKGYRDLEVWNRAHKLVLSAYGVTGGFPKEESVLGSCRSCGERRIPFQQISLKGLAGDIPRSFCKP